MRAPDSSKITVDLIVCYPGFVFARHKQQWAVLDESGHYRTDFHYDAIDPFDDGLAAVRRGGLQGYIDPFGQEIIPANHEKIRELGHERFLARRKGNWHLYDRSGKQLNDNVYQKVSAFYEGFAVVKANGKYGLLNERGDIVCDTRYDQIRQFFEGFAMVSRDGKWGHIDQTGREVIPLIYDEVFVFYDGLAVARKGEKWGFIDSRNQAVLPFVYDYVEYFESNRALISKDGKWGYIDRNGDPIISIIYDRIHPFRKGMAKVELNGKEGYINYAGEIVVEPVYDQIYRFLNDVAITRKGDSYGYIKRDGSVISDAVWDAVYPFIDGVAKVRKGDKYGLINRENEILLPADYDELGAYSGGMVSVRQGHEWVFVDALPGDGDPVTIDPRYAARVKVDGEWGYIDQSGRTFGFAEEPVEFVEQVADLGTLVEEDAATYTFHFRNNGSSTVKVEDLDVPCGCEYWLSPESGVPAGEYGQITLRCRTTGISENWRVTVPVSFDNDQPDIPLVLSARRSVDVEEILQYDEVPVNGRYVFLLDISASMDELPLAKMVFSKLAASLCRNDNISIVSFNSFSTVELLPTVNHSEVVHTIRQLKPALKTDASRGLRLSYAILEEEHNAMERHIYMASDGDIDSTQLIHILDANDFAANLTIFVFSYTGDRTAYQDLVDRCSFDGVRYVYVDRENISEILSQEYLDIGCLPPELDTDTIRYHRTEDAPHAGLSAFKDQRRFGLVDAWDNVIIPPVFEQIEFPGAGLVKVRNEEHWSLFDECEPVTTHFYDSIANYHQGRAWASRDEIEVLLDKQGRELDYVPELEENLIYEDLTVLEGQPFANLTLLLDVSSSMNAAEKMPILKETFRHFTGLLRYDDKVGVVTYTSEAILALPTVPAARRRTITETVDALRSRGSTKILEGLIMAYETATREYIEGGNNRVIIATDGMFESSPELLNMLDKFKARDIHLSFFLFGKRENSIHAQNLRALASRAGGSYSYIQAETIARTMLEQVLIIENQIPPEQSAESSSN